MSSPTRQVHAFDAFLAARALPPAARPAFLEKECGGDVDLLNELLGLLDEDDGTAEFADKVRQVFLGRSFPDTRSFARTVGVTPAFDSERPERVGPYRILEVIGEGGMGTVYLAEQQQPIRRRVALKVIKLGMDTREVIARFEVERQALALMNHPNIAKVYDAGATENGRPYFVMEHVPGVSITEHCDRQRLSVRDRLEIFAHVCEALHHAHQKGIIHRDIKPSNILVAVDEDSATPKIIDFGVAKATSHRLTESTVFTEQGVLIGTPEYMSPEQAEMTAQDIDTRTDVYSLGVLLYELLVGALPFDPRELRAAGYAGIQRHIREQEPSKPSTRLSTLGAESEKAAQRRASDIRTLVRRLRGDLDWITMRALAKDRTHRYESASAFASDIARHLNHEPVVAGPPGVGYRLKKLLRRHRPAALGSTLVLVALLVGLGVGQGGLVVAVTVVLVLLVAGLGVSTALLRRARIAQQGEARQRQLAEEQRLAVEEQRTVAQEARKIAEENARLALAREREAEEQRRLAQEERTRAEVQYREVVRLSDVKRLAELEDRARALWPAMPGQLGAMEEWREEARDLAARSPEHQETLDRLRAQALPYSDEDAGCDRDEDPVAEEIKKKHAQREKLAGDVEVLERDLAETHEEPTVALEEEDGPHALTRAEKETKLVALRREHARLGAETAQLEPMVGSRRTWRFSKAELQWRHDVLAALVEGLKCFCEPDPARGDIASVEERIVSAETVEERTVSSPDARASWEQAIAEVGQLDVYGGFELKPQLGLVPLRRDPLSGLWEFWHAASGARPRPDPDPDAESPWIIEEDTGIVVVLVPGDTFKMGAQKEDPEGFNYDPEAKEREGPLHDVTLMPYFLSRYLMTQGQWRRIRGTNPSYFGPDQNAAGKQSDLRYPAEQVSWEECRETLARADLVLPTEAQWEYGARGRTTTPWWTGSEKESLQGAANLADRFAMHNGPAGWVFDEWLFDGYVGPSPVGSFRPNPFGLHDVLGNVWEWCRDEAGEYGNHERSPGDAQLIVVPGARDRAYRGGSFSVAADVARVSNRVFAAPVRGFNHLGLRAARECR